MGTRNLTCVVADKKLKVSQYCQWDGHPDGQGVTILEFLRDKLDLKKFVNRLTACRWITEDEYNAYWAEAGADNSGFVNMEVSDKFKQKHPQLSHDMGGDVLEFIQNSTGEVVLNNDIDFAQDSLFCKWAYVIDLDKGVFEVYEGFNKSPVADDSFFAGDDSLDQSQRTEKYYPVRLAMSFSLDELTDDETFVALFNEEDEEDEAVNMTEATVLEVFAKMRDSSDTINTPNDEVIRSRVCNYVAANMDDFLESYSTE